MRIGTGLYVHNSVEAAALYREAFGLELGYHVLNPDGSYFHSELYKDGKEFLSVVEAPEGRGEDSIVQLGFDFDSEVEMQRAFALLREGADAVLPDGQLKSLVLSGIIDGVGGVMSFVKCIARELAPHNILVNCVNPGPVLTDMLNGLTPE